MVEMAMKDILPAVSEYSRSLSDTLLSKKAINKDLPCAYEEETLKIVCELSSKAYETAIALQKALSKKTEDPQTLSMYYKDKVLPKMQKLRKYADELENLVSSDYWPFPTYGDLLFGI
jgi:glutamine synthetase